MLHPQFNPDRELRTMHVQTDINKAPTTAGGFDKISQQRFQHLLTKYKKVHTDYMTKLRKERIEPKLWRSANQVINLDAMDSEHLENAILYMQGLLGEIDDAIVKTGTQIINAARSSERYAMQLASFATYQTEVEELLALLIDEHKRRDGDSDTKLYVRSYNFHNAGVKDPVLDSMGQKSNQEPPTVAVGFDPSDRFVISKELMAQRYGNDWERCVTETWIGYLHPGNGDAPISAELPFEIARKLHKPE